MKKQNLKELNVQEIQSINGGNNPFLYFIQRKIDEILEIISEETTV
ncbi:hypothetical protein [Aquimarina pacifica]|nr:hypothetical protein [Aquimarina pacifica]